MERTEMIVGDGANCLRVGCLSLHRLLGERRRLPDVRLLWQGTSLLRIAPFPTINPILSNAAELRQQSRHVVGVPMEKPSPMTERDVASEHPNLIEGCEPLRVLRLARQRPEDQQSLSQRRISI
jgi:hypothetical protein